MKTLLKGIFGGIIFALVLGWPLLAVMGIEYVPNKIDQMKKDHSDMRTISLNVEDKYYRELRWSGKQYKIVIKYNNKEKEIEVSKDDFYKIKVGDKVLCDVYCQEKKIVAIELNEHWKEAS